jgi:hypothetical protein
MHYGVTAVCAPPSNDHRRCCGFGADGTPCACACHGSTAVDEGRAAARRAEIREHELKTWPEFFRAIREGRKRHEVRANDRDFRVGDVLVLREYEPSTNRYTGELERRRVSYVTSAFLPPPLVAMSLECADCLNLCRTLDEERIAHNHFAVVMEQRALVAEAECDRLSRAVEALIEQWREVDTDGHAHDPAAAFNQGVLQCADELEVALASPAPAAEDGRT